MQLIRHFAEAAHADAMADASLSKIAIEINGAMRN